MGVIVKYKFDQTIYENLIPTFNSGFTDYIITDETDADGFTIRTIDNNSGALPTAMRFGTHDGVIVAKQKCLLDVISLDGNNINDMGNMFRGCQNLKSVSMSNLTSKVTGMNNLFRNCSSLAILNISNLDTSQVVSMSYMFHGCSSLTSLDTSNFNTSQVTDMNNMFSSCSSLTSLDLSNFNTEKVINMRSMFQNCSSLTSLNISNFNTSQADNMGDIFNGCSSLTSLDLSNFNTEKVTNMAYMFSNCSSLISLDLSNFNTEKVTNMTNTFQGCSSLTHLDISSFNGSALTTGCGSMFFGCVLLQEIIFPKKFITNKCTNISAMFRNCPSLKYIDVSDWDTSNVTTINQTFNGCKSLTSLDLSSWDTTNVTSYYQTFNGCTSLQSLDISNFNILSSVTDTNTHITVCKKLVHIGMLYCNSETINIIANQIGGTRTIWYQDANLSDLTQLDNITYKKYQSTTLSLNEPIQLRSIGDVHDEINYETGEYIQRIGEVVFDGSEDENWYIDMLSNNGTRLNMTFKVDLDNIIDYNFATTGMLCDRFIQVTGSSLWGDDVQGIGSSNGSGVKIGIPKSNLTTQNVNGFRYWLSQNPITVQYQLAQPIITKIDTTTLDQNNSYKSSQQTYEESTYISVQSDTVVTPTSNIDYEIYSSTGTITGTSATIENAEAGTPVSGVVYGETLLNVIQEPSEDEFVCTDNFSGQETTIENSVAGNIKDVIVKGDTLVNILEDKMNKGHGSWVTKTTYDKYTREFSLTLNASSGTGWNVTLLSLDATTISKLVDGQTYTLSFTITKNVGVTQFICLGTRVSDLSVGTHNVLITYSESSNSFFNFSDRNNTETDMEFSCVFNALVEGDHTTKSIPYFNGIGSVTNYRTIENMQPTCTYTENNGTYWCDTTTVNPTVGKRYFIKIFNNPNNIITRFFYGGVIVDTTTDYGIITATDRTGMRLHFYNLNSATVTITEEEKNAIRFLICEYQDGMENWEINEHFEESYTVQMPILKITGKNLFDITKISDKITISSLNNRKTFIPNANSVILWENTYNESGQFTVTIAGYNKGTVNLDWNYRIRFSYTDNTTDTGYQYISPKEKSYTTASGKIVKNIFIDNPFVVNNYHIYIDSLQIEKGSVATEYQPYKSNILSANENIELNSIGDVYDELNVTTGELTKYVGIDENSQPYLLDTPVTEKVNVTIIDQDNVQQDYIQLYDTITYLKPQSYELIPTVEYKNPSYDVLLKENTQYTIKLNRTNIIEGTPLTVNLGGTELSIEDSTDSFTITTPSTLTNNTLSIGGFGNRIKEVMIIEGEYVDRDLDFFEGFISVENPIVQIYNDNMWGKLILPPATIESFKTNYQSYITTKKPVLFLKPNTRYIINADITTKEQIVANLQEITENGTTRGLCGFNITGTGRIASYFDTTNGEVYLNFFPGYDDEDIKMVFDLLEQTNFTVCEYTKYGNSVNTVIEKKSNILTTYPQVTLRSMGDIKDEWDVVGETVTRRIGEVVLDGSENWVGSIQTDVMGGQGFRGHVYMSSLNLPKATSSNKVITDKTANNEWADGIYIHPQQIIYYAIPNAVQVISTITDFKQYLSQNPITVQYELATPITESVRITPPNPQTSTASITIPTQLNHVEDTSDFLVWNPYKEHYVRYNYVEDGVVLDSYTWENLTDLNERQFVEFYNRRTYIDQPYHSYVASYDSKGTSKYVLIEPNQDYTVNVRFSELPTCETVKVNLGGTEVEMNVNDPHVHVTTPNTLVNNLCSISGDGLDGKVTDILVIHCLEHEGFADIDYFEGIDGIGEIVEVDGVPKSKIVMEQTNGNLLPFLQDSMSNNGNNIGSPNNSIRPNKQYVFKIESQAPNANGGSYFRIYSKDGKLLNGVYGQSIANNNDNMGKPMVIKVETPYNASYYNYYKVMTADGSASKHYHAELCYADMEKDYIRPRYYDKEEILLPMQLHRINTVYDNFYYDEMKGYYRIQQSIGHKYFVGADSENWTLIERGQRVLRFRYNNADIQMKSLGEFTTNRLPNGTAISPYECCAFSGSTFIISIDKERLTSESLIAFKEWLANNNLHLYYQLASPLMIDLPQYPNRIEFNTYKDEIYTFFKNCKPTVFTLSVPLDQTYRFYELEQGEGYANRVELTDERMTEEDTLYIDTIYGSGISNLIEEPNNVDTMLKPNYEGKATSHSLTNGKVSTIGVHGFEPNDVTIGNYNTVTKQYELTVQAQQETNTNTETLAVPYKLEIYEDGTKDRVYYNSEYKQWMFEGGQTLTVPYNASTGAFTSAIEVFRGLQPRSGLIGEFKVRFTSGTTSVRLYYSINGTTYGYTTLRDMTDEVDYYIGFFNTGGSKIDMGTKIDANAEYTKLVPINGTIPECLMINQIQNITECTYYQDKTYYYSDVVSPLVLDVYDGTTTITELNGAVIDIQNNAHNKQALIYGDTTYTVYWTYVGGEGNIKVTLGGVTQEVVATQGYATITTSNTDLERGLLIGGFDVTIKDLMLIKGERITDLKYFEGSRAVGTAFTDEDGNTMYKITFVTGSELINDKFEDMITFEDNRKHNVVVTKLLGAKPNKN